LMYNLHEDPFETVNLAFNVFYKSKRQELHEILLKWIEQTGDTFALPQSPDVPVWKA
jgi:hypothetical protein